MWAIMAVILLSDNTTVVKKQMPWIPTSFLECNTHLNIVRLGSVNRGNKWIRDSIEKDYPGYIKYTLTCKDLSE